MGIAIGLPKYIVGVLLSVGFVSMYIFGGAIITFSASVASASFIASSSLKGLLFQFATRSFIAF